MRGTLATRTASSVATSEGDRLADLQRLSKDVASLGFSKVKVATAEIHVVAFDEGRPVRIECVCDSGIKGRPHSGLVLPQAAAEAAGPGTRAFTGDRETQGLFVLDPCSAIFDVEKGMIDGPTHLASRGREPIGPRLTDEIGLETRTSGNASSGR